MTTTQSKSTPTAPLAHWCSVEHHMGTAVSLTMGLTDPSRSAPVAQHFFETVRDLEQLLSRFIPTSQLSMVASGDLAVDNADPAIREVLTRCSALRDLTHGCFEHEPRRRSGNRTDPVLDPNAFAKGWIVEEAVSRLSVGGLDELLVSAGGDVVVRRRTGAPWRIGIQHPSEAGAVLGTIELTSGAVATSGTYERGNHIRRDRSAVSDTHRHGRAELASVTVVGPDLAVADALATAVWASGTWLPAWWADVDPGYGILGATAAQRTMWLPPSHPVGHAEPARFVSAGVTDGGSGGE